MPDVHHDSSLNKLELMNEELKFERVRTMFVPSRASVVIFTPKNIRIKSNNSVEPLIYARVPGFSFISSH